MKRKVAPVAKEKPEVNILDQFCPSCRKATPRMLAKDPQVAGACKKCADTAESFRRIETSRQSHGKPEEEGGSYRPVAFSELKE
ncbi:MAG: hypothetical protein HYT28_03525 [Parcubacteria group bacterium]|nr:hypothetical protein [Parcubacteria group bacterium]